MLLRTESRDMSNAGPSSEDIEAELESQLTRQEIKKLLTTEEYHQYQEGTSLLDLLDDEIQALIEEDTA